MILRTLNIFILSFLPVFFFPQNTSLDSLFKILPTVKNDTAEVNILNYIGWELAFTDPDSGKVICKRAVELAQKTKFKRGEAHALNTLGIVEMFMNNYPEALEHHRTALAIRKKLNDKAAIAASISNIGLVYKEQGDFSAALNNYREALILRMEVDDKPGIAVTYMNIGNIFKSQGNLPEALKNYLLCLGIQEKLNDKRAIADSYNNIGIVFRILGDHKNAISNLNTALKLKTEVNDKIGMANAYNNLGIVNEQQERYDAALENYLKALKLYSEYGDKSGVANSYVNIGVLNDTKGNNSDALNYFSKAATIYSEIGDKEGLAAALVNSGNIKLELKELQPAKLFYARAIAEAEPLRDIDDLSHAYEGLSKIHDLVGDHKAAFHNYKLYILYRDSLTNEENTKKAVQAEMNYKFEKQQAADSIRNVERTIQENIKHEQEIGQQRTYTYGGIIGFILMLIVAGISFNAYRQKQQANQVITLQKQIVEQKQKEILDSIYYAKRIQKSLLPTDKYISRNLFKLNKSET